MVDQPGSALREQVGTPDPDSEPPLDPYAIADAYRLHRARRRARIERRREKRRAGLRFWLVVLVLIAASVALVVLVVDEVQKLFGILD
jgi:hypothetical protein